MNDMSTPNRRAFSVMIAMYLLAAIMLAGCVGLLYNAYQQAKQETAIKPPSTPEKEKETPTPKGVGVGDAFALAGKNPWFYWTLLNAIMLAGLGTFFAVREPIATEGEDAEQEDRLYAKLGYFAVCSVIGFFTVVCLALPYTWIKSTDILSRAGWKTQDPWLVILGYVLGLGAMFASLLAVKSEERSNVNIRRWIYGYNAFLGGLLFLAIVGVLNAWFALYGPEVSDWTSTNIYSLSPSTKRILRSLDKPVRAYVILPFNTQIKVEVVNLLKNCKTVADQLDIVELSPNRNVQEVDKLIAQYSVLRDETGSAMGILLVQDPDSNLAQHTFIKLDDLEESAPGGMRGESGPRYFKGEQALYTALRDFREGKKKVTIYFTQDSGELSIDETAVRTRREVPPTRSALNAKTKLEQAGYQVKALKLGEREVGSEGAPSVPEDALIVIVADPLKMTPEKAAVLDAYMKRPKKEGVEPGKLIVLTDVHYGPDGKVLPTGLEPLVQNYGVQIGQNVVFSVKRDPTAIILSPPPQGVDAEIAQSLSGLLGSADIVFNESRSITALPSNPAYNANALLVAYSEATIRGPQGDLPVAWTEEKQIADPVKYVRDLFTSREVIKKVGPQPVSVAVTVRERTPQQPPPNQFTPPPPAKPGTPRVAVFGDASFATDAAVERSDVGVNLILTTLAWVRGKPELAVDVPPKERKAYRLLMTPETLNRVLYFPVLWILLVIIATGIGVGILRRR